MAGTDTLVVSVSCNIDQSINNIKDVTQTTENPAQTDSYEPQPSTGMEEEDLYENIYLENSAVSQLNFFINHLSLIRILSGCETMTMCERRGPITLDSTKIRDRIGSVPPPPLYGQGAHLHIAAVENGLGFYKCMDSVSPVRSGSRARFKTALYVSLNQKSV